MTAYPLILAAHVLGAVLWIGGALAAGRLARLRIEGDAGVAKGMDLVFKLAAHGMALTILGGIGLLTLAPLTARQGWFHLKLVLVAAAIALHLALRAMSKRPKKKQAAAAAAFHWGLGAAAAAILVLVFTRPF